MKKIKHLDFKSDIEKFLPAQNMIAYYYDKVFNIQIITVMRKNKQIWDSYCINISAKYRDDTKIYILIRDSNKLIFKYKILKFIIPVANLFIKDENAKFNYETINDKDLSNLIYSCMDKKLCDYCKKHKYINTDEVLKRNLEIDEEYQQFLKKQNQKSKRKQK